jgi:hypothetical protein
MSNTIGLQAEAKKVVTALHLEEVKENLEGAAHQATRSISRAASQLEKTAKTYPLATAGLVFGAGALLGAILHSALRPAPSAGDLIVRALKQGATNTGDSMRSGYRSARRAIG